MTGVNLSRDITHLDQLVAALPEGQRCLLERIFHLTVTTGHAVPPGSMESWLAQQFGSVDAVRQQKIVRVTNRVTLDGALFNALRAQRPIQAPSSHTEHSVLERKDSCDFCTPLRRTTADPFGRIRGRHCITASNVAKYDGWHAVIVFDEHHPLKFTHDQVADYLDTAQRWARTAHQIDPAAQYPFFLWNCLWRSGASIVHGHAQMTLTRDMHYAKVESWRKAASGYRQAHNTDYFADLLDAHRALGLAVEHGSATILPSLTPFKDKETYIIGHEYNDDLKSALYWVLHAFVEHLGVSSFNVALYQPPLADSPADWDQFPYIFRAVDRGKLESRTSDVGSMEFFSQSVVSTDPFRLADTLHHVLRGGVP